MEVQNVSELLTYVFEPDHDFPDNPSRQELKRLKRIMHIMVRFYERGSQTKKMNLEEFATEEEKIQIDEKMIREQLKALEDFPEVHPRKQEYITDIKEELKKLEETKAFMKTQKEPLEGLYAWSLKIVDSVNWLETQLVKYIKEQYPDSDIKDLKEDEVTPQTYRIYKRGLDEITYNLQESQDFFEASLDGRLTKYHQIHERMIQAQLAIIKKYPADNRRRQTIEAELVKDLEYVRGNMEEDPKTKSHREQMQLIHKDFFAVLKWQRAKLVEAGYGKADEEIPKEEKSNAPAPSMGGCPVDHKSMPSGAKCPVPHSSNGTKKPTDIHRLYEQETKPKPSLVFN